MSIEEKNVYDAKILETTLRLWLLAYALPALATLISVALVRSTWRQLLIIHIGLLLSVAVAQILIRDLGRNFPFMSNALMPVLFVLCILIAYAIRHMIGILYVISALIQQLALLSTAFLLLPYAGAVYAILLIAPFFALAHLIGGQRCILKLFITALWVTMAIILFFWLGNLFLGVLLHAFFGIVLMHREILWQTQYQ